MGYARVPFHRKKIFDEALASFKMMEIIDTDTTLNNLLSTSYDNNSRFRYVSDYHDAIDPKCPSIDIYIESKRK